ncbi:choice-of-anchor A family protein [Streptomyces sp. x-80]|uniref:choice-of-anchor A family protein n=1 Tax=Streptomyces sp. x-80 TaxID=2789282 RepID=UPI00397E9792
MLARSSLALLAVGSGLLIGPLSGTAQAASTGTCLPSPLGSAGQYAEFVAESSRRVSDSEGAVAIGGDATLGDPERKEGFSVGSRLSGSDVSALPGGVSLVVGGELTANQVVPKRGKAVYQKLIKAPGASFAIDGPHQAGPSPVDFAKEFSQLRSSSAAWGKLAATGTVRGEQPDTLTLKGDRRFNVFSIPAAELEKARHIKIKVPLGATALVNVLGSSYDMHANATYGVSLWDHTAGRYVQDDYQAGSDAFKSARSKLLWNFPQATKVLKNYTSWPGTILAPNASVALGRAGQGGEVGPGHVNGSVIAKEMTSISGAETHHMSFRGCIPDPEKPEKPDPEKPDPSKPGTPAPQTSGPETPGTPGPGKPGSEDGPGPEQSKQPSPSAAPVGNLASTGSDNMLLYTGLSGMMIAAGTLLAIRYAKRRGPSQ